VGYIRWHLPTRWHLPAGIYNDRSIQEKNLPQLQGLIVPLVTPFGAKGAVDTAALNAVADYVLREGAAGLMLTALTGEGNLLCREETETVWKSVLERYRGRVPVVPAIFPATTADAVRWGQLAVDLGASAVMVAAVMPELYGRRAEKHVRRFFEDFCAAVSIPVALFNYPSVAGYDLTPALVEELTAIDNIRYIKESTSDSRRVSEIFSRTKGRIQVICGSPDIALESLALGCTTWITAIMNVIPAACRGLIDAVESGDLRRARELNFRVIRPMFELIQKSSNTIGTVKAGLALRGIDVGVPRAPGLPLAVDQEVGSDFDRIFAAERELLAPS
jgi:4-hydroxy-tetrahydrodipicolinate synthase